MTNNDLKVVRAMEMYGGGFVKQLAQLAIKADPINLRIIKESFGKYWKSYEKIAADNNIGSDW